MAHRLDSVIEAAVLERVAPPSLELIQRAAREALREHDALERGRADELRRLEAAVAAAERAFDQCEAHQTYLRRRLAEKLEVALRDLNDRKAFFQLHPVTPPLTLSDAEVSELQGLLADLPSLWRHPLVSNEQRKAMIRTIIRRVDATPGPDAWNLAITWAGGVSTDHALLTEPGERAQLTEAFAFISSRFADGASAPQISRELNASKVSQERGPWTVRRVRDVITQLQRGVVEGLARLPTRQGVSQRIVALAEAGLTPRQIVERLGAEGAVNLRHRAVTVEAVYGVLRRRRFMSKNCKMREEVKQLLRLWAGTASPAVLASRLNERGLSTNRGRPWTAKSVTEKLASLNLDDGRQGLPSAQRRSRR